MVYARDVYYQHVVIAVGVYYKIMTCRNVCENYRFKRVNNDVHLYSLGAKYCSGCDVFLDWEGRRCPCCGVQLRCKARGSRCRKKSNHMVVV